MTRQIETRLRALTRRWARLGAAFAVSPAPQTPDIERLLIDTARLAAHESRLFIMAATWLLEFGSLVAKHRLRALARAELEPEYHEVLGLMLDLVRQENGTRHFNEVIEVCRPADAVADASDDDEEIPPLFDVYRDRPRLLRRLRRAASPVSRQWGRLAEPMEFKPDALRSRPWLIARNPSLRLRADLGGDLRCSILLTLADRPEAGASEMVLARACGVTRRAVRLALDQLELAGRVLRQPARRGTTISLADTRAAA